MDISGLGSLSTALGEARTGDAVGVLVQKKAMQLAEQNAAQLLQALPPATSNPPHLGQHIDVRA